MLKYFKTPFADVGTRTTIPETDPGTGEVSYPTGYGSQYQAPDTDPTARDVERSKFNDLMYSITGEVKLLQEHSVADFITTALNGGTPHEYSIGDYVRYTNGGNTRVYMSRKNTNTSLPSVAADWTLIRGNVPAAAAAGTGNALTATFAPAFVTPVDGDCFLLEHTAANTGGATLAIDGGSALPITKGAAAPLTANDIPGAGSWGYYVYDSTTPSYVLLNPANGVNVQVYSALPSVAASASAGALTLTLNAGDIDFRSPTLTSGVPVKRTLAAPASLTVASGATLGTVNSQDAQIALLALDVGGTITPAVVNLSGGFNLNESGVISTTALSGSSNSAGVAYSTSAHANVAYRVQAVVRFSIVTAGTWISPSLVQPAGGEAFSAMNSLGFGQIEQDVTVSRSVGVTYYNTTSKPKFVIINFSSNGSASVAQITIGAISMSGVIGNSTGCTVRWPVSFMVRPGSNYSVDYVSGSGVFQWIETF
jgi:hypothetical protein